jgi:hypothetical protein
LALPGVVIANGESRANVVALLEELLAEAKAGKIQTFGAFMVDSGGCIATAFGKGGEPHAHHMVAGAVYLLRRCEINAGLES